MPLYTKVGLGPGHIVLHGDPAPPKRGTAPPPIFGPYLLWSNGRPAQQSAAVEHLCKLLQFLLGVLGSTRR